MAADVGMNRRAGLVAVALAMWVAACGAPAEAPPTATISASVSAARTSPPSPTVPPTWPLTGVGTDAVAARPALAIKVENSPGARPQVGLEQADIVWEEVVEGGITRFVAVYQSQVPAQVGPVRSVRPMDPGIVAPMHGILAYSGGQQPFVDAVAAAGVQSIVQDNGDGGFSRVTGRKAPHNVVGDPAAFWAKADGQRAVPPPAQFAYGRPGAATATASGTPAGRIGVQMSPGSAPVWEWSPGAGAYLRSEGSKPAESAAGGRLQATNVVLLSVEMSNTAFKDPAGAPVPETKIVGAGQGVVASGGRSIAVTWSKAAVDAPVVLTEANGPVRLEPGTTWIELVPQGSGGYTVG